MVCEPCPEPDLLEGQSWEEQVSGRLLRGAGLCQAFEGLFVFKCDIQTVKITSLEKIQIPHKFIGICCLGQFMGLQSTERDKYLNVSF